MCIHTLYLNIYHILYIIYMYIKDPVCGPCQSCVDYENTKTTKHGNTKTTKHGNTKTSMETPKQLSMY